MIEQDSETLREYHPDVGHDGLAAEPYLFLVIECDRPEARGARYSLQGVGEVRWGRAGARTSHRDAAERLLMVGVCDRWLSSIHARMICREGRWLFEDLSSTNGSVVDGVAVRTSELRDGAVLALGHTVFIYREGLPTPKGGCCDADLSKVESLPDPFTSLLPEYARELATLQRMAKSDLSILLLGETGCGKELLARAVHATSERKGGLVAVNCGAVPEALVESQFFGHEKGAFSGAHREALGFVRAADQGTLFLDEIGDLRRPSQAALLRVLQEREVTPVGSVRPHKVDIQVVSATHRPIDSLAISDDFRGDLLARLSGFRHVIPPLRRRREDLGSIYAAMMHERRTTGQTPIAITPEAACALLRYDWPGNVRELKHTLAACAVLCEGEALRLEHLPAPVRSRRTSAPADAGRPIFTEHSEQAVRERLVENLRAHSGNVSAAAEAMRTSRTQVYRWVKRFGIDLAAFGGPRVR